MAWCAGLPQLKRVGQMAFTYSGACYTETKNYSDPSEDSVNNLSKEDAEHYRQDNALRAGKPFTPECVDLRASKLYISVPAQEGRGDHLRVAALSRQATIQLLNNHMGIPDCISGPNR